MTLRQRLIRLTQNPLLADSSRDQLVQLAAVASRLQGRSADQVLMIVSALETRIALAESQAGKSAPIQAPRLATQLTAWAGTPLPEKLKVGALTFPPSALSADEYERVAEAFGSKSTAPIHGSSEANSLLNELRSIRKAAVALANKKNRGGKAEALKDVENWEETVRDALAGYRAAVAGGDPAKAETVRQNLVKSLVFGEEFVSTIDRDRQQLVRPDVALSATDQPTKGAVAGVADKRVVEPTVSPTGKPVARTRLMVGLKTLFTPADTGKAVVDPLERTVSEAEGRIAGLFDKLWRQGDIKGGKRWAEILNAQPKALAQLAGSLHGQPGMEKVGQALQVAIAGVTKNAPETVDQALDMLTAVRAEMSLAQRAQFGQALTQAFAEEFGGKSAMILKKVGAEFGNIAGKARVVEPAPVPTPAPTPTPTPATETPPQPRPTETVRVPVEPTPAPVPEPVPAPVETPAAARSAGRVAAPPAVRKASWLSKLRGKGLGPKMAGGGLGALAMLAGSAYLLGGPDDATEAREKAVEMTPRAKAAEELAVAYIQAKLRSRQVEERAALLRGNPALAKAYANRIGQLRAKAEFESADVPGRIHYGVPSLEIGETDV
jgi:hypothetical protein